jgi:hypothetical protein
VKLTLRCRARALEAGVWQRSDGTFIDVRDMPDGHLLNAYLLALQQGEPPCITSPLGAEVVARHLETTALAMAAERMQPRHAAKR